MNKTNELYYDDPYIKEFDARVLSVEKRDNNIFSVVLDQTAFFPESGGQVSDIGTINGKKVKHVSIKEGIIYHQVEGALSENDEVHGILDFDFRFSNMQQHSGEHVFSGLVKKYYNYENVGFHLSENSVTMDYDGPLTNEDIKKLEQLANKAVFDDISIIASFPDKEALSRIDYRAKLDDETMGDVRIVSIEGVDNCACCAPHVSSTGQIGIIKVIDHINYKGGSRLFILCGNRALDDYSTKQDILLELSHRFSVPMGEITEAVKRTEKEIQTLKSKVSELSKYQFEADLKTGMDTPLGCVIFTQISDDILIRNTANEMMKTNDVLFFAGNDENGYSFLIASNNDALSIFNNIKEALDLKGGGKNPMIRGFCKKSKADITKLLQG